LSSNRLSNNNINSKIAEIQEIIVELGEGRTIIIIAESNKSVEKAV
jgi:ABC-type multidrug transport system fused ATPase/permease subunit